MKRIRNLPLLTLACLLGASAMALAAPIPVNNASFERPMLDSGGWSNDLPDPDLVDGGPDWIGQNGANDGNTFIEFIPGFNSEGNQHLGMQGNYYVFQNTGVAWKANTGYSLTVGVGNRGENPGALTLIGLTSSTEAPGPDNTLPYQNANEFLDDPLYISGAGMTIDSGSNGALSFTDYTVSFITGSEPPPGNIVIFLGDEGTEQRSHFDNVRLNANTGPSLIAHFPLDENGNSETFGGFVAATVDESVTFGTAGANGNTGTSATFDGSGIVQHEWNADLNPESFTLALWAKSEGGAGAWNSPVTSRDEQNGGPQKGYLIYDDEPGGVWTFWSGSNLGGWQILNGPAVKIGEWQHLAISYDNGTQTKRLYVDGELVGEQNEPVAPAETTPFSIGGGGDFGADFRFIGDIDDIGLWNYALSEQELLTAMTQGVLATQPESLPAPVAHFALDEDGNSPEAGGFVASTVDNVTFGAPGANANTGGAATFDGSGLIQHDWSADLNPESFTLTLWAKSDGGAGAWNSPVTSRHDLNPDSQGYLIYDNEPGGVWTFWSGNGTADGNWQVLDGPDVTLGEWEHIAISYDNATETKKLYVNGELAVEANDAVFPNDTTPFNIGGGGDFGADFRFIGDIDDIGLWDVALNDNEILLAMESGVNAFFGGGDATPSPNLIGYWPADEGSGETLENGVANKVLNGTATGATWTPDAGGHTGAAGDYAIDVAGATDSYVEVPATGENFEEITVTAWIKGVQTGDWTGLIQARGDVNIPIGMGVRAGSGELSYTWNDNNANTYSFESGLAIPADEWAFIALTVRPDQGRLFLGAGGEFNSAVNEIDHLAQLNDAVAWFFGKDNCCGTERNFDGLIDDVSIWNVALEDSELEAMFNGTSPINTREVGGGQVNPLDPDGDGIFTPLEEKHGLDPNVADADSDKDGDGVIASVEIFELGTLANNPDTDGDGLSDGVETNTGTYVDATNTGTNPTSDDTDDDGLKDGAEVPDSDPPGTSPLAADTDGDGFDDGKELLAGTDPLDANSKPDFPVVIGYWPFDDQGSTETADLGPAGITSLVNGDPEWVPGHSGNANDFAIKFDGEDDSVTTDVSLLNDLAELTMSFWVRMEEEQLGNRIGLVGQNDAVEYGMINPTTMQWWSPAGAIDVEFGPIVEEWTHVAVVLNAEGFKVFANGEILGENAGGGPVTSGDTLNIGGDGVFDVEGNFFLGEIDDVAIWDTALSDAQIADLANQVICPLGACGGSDFHVRAISRAADGMVNLTWDSSPGRFYDIEASPDLSPGSWVPMGVAIPAEGGEALVTSASVEGDVAQLMEYFRVGRVDPPPFLETSFEDGLGEWTTTSVAGSMWEAGVPTAGPPAAKTGANVAGTGLAGDYEDGTVGSLRTPVIDTLGNRVSLSFSYFLEAVEGEGGRVNFLEADGSLIQNFEPIYTGGEDGNTADWTDVSFRLPNLDPARPFIIEFEFLTGDDGDPNNGAGWFIDDVSIGK